MSLAGERPTPVAPERVAEWIERFAAISEPDSGPGVTRLAHTALERRAHEVFTDFMAGLGLTVWTDAAGNTIAEKPGTEETAAVGTGSHLDSVPSAGRFDGIAGVVAAMLLAERVVTDGVGHRRPLRFVAFAGEEGARFGRACIGSRIVAGLTTTADLHQLHDAKGVGLAEAMAGVGLDPDAVADARWSPREWVGFVELHIEQGPVLADAGAAVGVVDVISGSTRLELTVDGVAAHSGGMPMHLRRDALTAVAEVVLELEVLAGTADDGRRITVGRLEALPGSITTIPGRCVLTVDIRDIDLGRQRATAEDVLERAATIAERRGVTLTSRHLAEASPEELTPSVRRTLIDVAREVGTEPLVLPSGASHDTQMIKQVCPVGMLFVPSRAGGVSHSPHEDTDFGDLARGADLLGAALLRLAR